MVAIVIPIHGDKNTDMNTELSKQHVEDRIFTIRGVQVMVDRDLAEMYGVSTGRLNEQVKRNLGKKWFAFSRMDKSSVENIMMTIKKAFSA